MQVDEESKTGKNLEIGGYESDSDDEREKKEEEEEKKTTEIEFTQAGQEALAQNKPAVVVAANCQHSQTMAKIMYGTDWTEVAVAKFTQVKDKKTHDVLKIYKLPDGAAKDPVYFLLPEKKLNSEVINPILSQLFGKMTASQLVVMQSLYKTQYPAASELNVPEGKMPMITHKTSHVSAELAGHLQSKVGSPAHFIAPATGLGAGMLVHGEMSGVQGYIATLITGSHYVSSESMAAFEPVLETTGVKSGDVAAVDRKPKFKEILKEANARGNAIFS